MREDNFTKSERTLAHFWERVTVKGADECWEWGGGRNPKGYGIVHLPVGVQRGAHRYAYEQTVGPIPDGLVIDHLCRNHGCVNPAHLEPVTSRENTLRGLVVNRETCRNGLHAWPDSAHTFSDGRAVCIECRRAVDKRRGRKSCPDCGAQVRTSDVARHRRRWHGWVS